MYKRCLTIQDFSCMGRCSLTVALPILSACGVETVAIPTAVLSNHTAYPSWTYHDLTNDILPIVDKWEGFNNEFDAIYTGYLGKGQVDVIKEVVSRLKGHDTMFFMDPAFGAKGRLYPGFDEQHVVEMRGLMKYADVILPNLTEACMLADEPYPSEYNEFFIRHLMGKLSSYGPSKIIISGLHFKENEIGCMSYDAKTREYRYYSRPLILDGVHGAGDCFASSIVGSYLNGVSFNDTMKIAHNFIRRALQNNVDEKIDPRLYGPVFEPVLPTLYSDIISAKRKAEE